MARMMCLMIAACCACGQEPKNGAANYDSFNLSTDVDADTGAVGCPDDITTCGDRVCQSGESATCCAFDCNNLYHNEASCIGTSCHTEMLNCRSDATCMAAVECAIACKGTATCIADCGTNAFPKTQLLFKCIDGTPCWKM